MVETGGAISRRRKSLREPHMQKLIDRKLLNAGLVHLTAHLVVRYNACLESMGLTPTALSEIDIDGVGWSPQVAQEIGNPHYLCNGLANPVAIIITPDQYDMPVFSPIYSWQRPLLRALFDKNQKQIRDITATHPVGIDLEDGISSFRGPEDLLLINEIIAVPHIEKLAEAAEEQAKLVTTFSEGLNSLIEDNCDALITSRRANGDLRRRKLDLKQVSFDTFDDFYTIAFGGAAVLRDVETNGDNVLVLEDEEAFNNIDKKKLGSAKVFYLYDAEFRLLEKLKKAKWVAVPLRRYHEEPALLDFKKELLLADALCDCEPDVNWRSLSSGARKGLLNKHADKVPEIYFELERFGAAQKAGRQLGLSLELEAFLAEPTERMPPETQKVLWTLLTHREPRNLLALYTVDVNAFLQRYSNWGEAKRTWAADYLAARYKHQHRIIK
jgi:hypothetical protein